MSDDSKPVGCPFCGEDTPHEHVISNALSPGDHPTYEELVAIKTPSMAEWCLEERSEGAGGCGACSICCGELRKSIEAILQCASSGGPGDDRFSLGLIRIECMRILGRPGAQNVPPLGVTDG